MVLVRVSLQFYLRITSYLRINLFPFFLIEKTLLDSELICFSVRNSLHREMFRTNILRTASCNFLPLGANAVCIWMMAGRNSVDPCPMRLRIQCYAGVPLLLPTPFQFKPAKSPCWAKSPCSRIKGILTWRAAFAQEIVPKYLIQVNFFVLKQIAAHCFSVA